jgi:hypothetical protein
MLPSHRCAAIDALLDPRLRGDDTFPLPPHHRERDVSFPPPMTSLGGRLQRESTGRCKAEVAPQGRRLRRECACPRPRERLDPRLRGDDTPVPAACGTSSGLLDPRLRGDDTFPLPPHHRARDVSFPRRREFTVRGACVSLPRERTSTVRGAPVSFPRKRESSGRCGAAILPSRGASLPTAAICVRFSVAQHTALADAAHIESDRARRSRRP